MKKEIDPEISKRLVRLSDLHSIDPKTQAIYVPEKLA